MIELLVTLAILGILSTLAAPSFTSLIERWRVGQSISDLESTLYYARSEGIKRGGGVILQRADSCPSSQWQCGWNLVDAKDNVLQTHKALNGVTLTSTTNEDKILFDRWGAISTSNATQFSWTVKASRQASSAIQELCVTAGAKLHINKQGGSC